MFQINQKDWSAKKKKRTVKSVISCYTNLLSEYKIGKTIQTCFLGFQSEKQTFKRKYETSQQ